MSTSTKQQITYQVQQNYHHSDELEIVLPKRAKVNVRYISLSSSMELNPFTLTVRRLY